MPKDSAVTRDHLVVNGRAIYLDDLVNPTFLRPKRIAELHEQLMSARPFPHLVLDGLFQPALLHGMSREYDAVKAKNWKLSEHRQEDRRGTLAYPEFGPATSLYFQTVYSTRFHAFMAQLTGIADLITDPSLLNGGLHDVPTGGRFDIHIDYTHHPVTGLSNRLVLITYLNEDWKTGYGGQLELWGADSKTCEVSIVPEFGRTIMFMNGPTAFHGCPAPVSEPHGRSRRSAAAYFYSPDHQAGSETPAYTMFMSQATRKHDIMKAVRAVTPPILLDSARKLFSALRRRS